MQFEKAHGISEREIGKIQMVVLNEFSDFRALIATEIKGIRLKIQELCSECQGHDLVSHLIIFKTQELNSMNSRLIGQISDHLLRRISEIEIPVRDFVQRILGRHLEPVQVNFLVLDVLSLEVQEQSSSISRRIDREIAKEELRMQEVYSHQKRLIRLEGDFEKRKMRGVGRRAARALLAMGNGVSAMRDSFARIEYGLASFQESMKKVREEVEEISADGEQLGSLGTSLCALVPAAREIAEV